MTTHKRHANDFYKTPEWVTHRLLDSVCLPSGEWLEPAAGDGAIIRALQSFHSDKYISWSAVDIDQAHETNLSRLIPSTKIKITNYLDSDYLHDPIVDVIITNPPYSLAEKFVKKAIETDAWVVFLMRLNFLCSAKRQSLFAAAPPDIYTLPNRPSFTNNGHTDMTEYAWYVWPPIKQRLYGICKTLNLTAKEDRL